ncbi:hypothetical protein BO82DRAFT_172754 [Aspergillus uvarum CBS 121591]|uniref:Uncharacterized protein n=1 Tax=Aspergillus uvarum CBS 121591 TaxID=1448315 RepID=A0A319BVX8_9EURO|nr:hypothetical protein BO82DRAFT_172754 [Aspergillus uvarum CBS 121591]PYH77826.1 hypothetical protein BO82DRAFT_172754 [Aspergillus uvarum CBS 121591]
MDWILYSWPAFLLSLYTYHCIDSTPVFNLGSFVYYSLKWQHSVPLPTPYGCLLGLY